MASAISKELLARLEADPALVEKLYVDTRLCDEEVAETLGIARSTLFFAINESDILYRAKEAAQARFGDRIKKRTLLAGLGDIKLGPGELGALAWAGKNFAGLSDRQVSEQTVRVEYQGAPREEERSTFVPNVVALPTHINSNLQRGATQGEDGDQDSSSAERSVANEGTDGSPK